MGSQIIDPELETIVDNETTHSPVVVAGGVVAKDHKDDASYFLKMLKQGVLIYDDSSGCWLFDKPRANLL